MEVGDVIAQALASNPISIGDGEVKGRTDLIEVVYKCSNSRCKHTQTLRYTEGEQYLPVTCCVVCRAGFGKELEQQMAERIGMFPVQVSQDGVVIGGRVL